MNKEIGMKPTIENSWVVLESFDAQVGDEVFAVDGHIDSPLSCIETAGVVVAKDGDAWLVEFDVYKAKSKRPSKMREWYFCVARSRGEFTSQLRAAERIIEVSKW